MTFAEKKKAAHTPLFDIRAAAAVPSFPSSSFSLALDTCHLLEEEEEKEEEEPSPLFLLLLPRVPSGGERPPWWYSMKFDNMANIFF